jgi:rRNA maturation endonuclease Nob1
MTQLYVLDAGVLISTWTDKKIDSAFITTPSIVEEVRNRMSRFRAETLFLLEKMHERTPSIDEVKRVESVATSTGDRSVLSTNDIELIALASTIISEGSDATLVSTDFAVLNTASRLDIPIVDPNQKFKQRITWGMRCPACYYKSKTPTRDSECPVCGTAMRRTPLRTRKKS